MPNAYTERTPEVLTYGHAAMSEEALEWIYRTAASLARDAEAAAALGSLARAEHEHRTALSATFPELEEALPSRAGHDDWAVAQFRRAVIPELDVDDVRALLVVAYRVERGGGELYERWAETAKTDEGRRLAEQLAKAEAVHRKTVATLFARTCGGSIDDDPQSAESIEWPHW